MPAHSPWRSFSDEIKAIALFASLVLVVTAASLFISNPESQTGVLRSLSRIPAHGVLLALAGVAMGVVTFPFSKRIDLGMLLVAASSVILLDLDHLPVFLGLAQPIRPAHSFVFLAFTFLILELAFRRRPELGLMVMSASLIHMTIDTGMFALLSPISFNYYRLADWWPALFVVSLLFAALAGYAKRRTPGNQDGRLLFKAASEEARNL